MRKLGAIVLAIMMIAMTGTVWADGASLTNHDGTTASVESVRFLKEITAYNPDGVAVNEPTATYTYTIAAGSGNVSVTDADNVTAVTTAGVTTGIAMTSETNSTAGTTSITLTYSPSAEATLTTASTGSVNTKWVEINFSGVNFGAPGIYRYVITETATTYDGSNGIVYAGETTGENAGKKVRYLDVYVKASASYDAENTETPQSNWDVYGYAMFTTDGTAIKDDSLEGGNESTLYKTTGFVADSTQTTAVVADSYYTFNVTISKTVANDTFVQARHDQFPFTVSFENTTVTGDVLPTVTTSDNYASAGTVDLSAGNINNQAALAPTIGHQGTVTYYGLPSGTSITVSETNNLENVTYTVTETAGDATFTSSAIAYNQSSNEAVVAAQNAGETNEDKVIAITNTLALISPTGLVLRYAPYALILAAGIALFVIFAVKRRKHAGEDE